MKNLRLFLFACFCTCFVPVLSHAQVSPIGGLGSIQMFDNNGSPATSGCYYFYQAGTSTQIATFTDSSGTVQNTNPLCVGAGARAIAWLSTSSFYKIVACVANDGSFCSASDILWQQDNVPGGVTGGGGGGGAPFISNSANPATSGILRLATGDAVCWRNTANSSNLCFTKDTNDLLSWAGGSFKLPEVGAPTSVSGFDIIYADNTAHRYKQCSNGSACAQIANSGVDINATDQVTQLHFGATAAPLNASIPASNQPLVWDGTHISGVTVTESTFAFSSNGGGLNGNTCIAFLNSSPCAQTVLALPHTLVRFTYVVNIGAVGCSTNAVLGVRDVTSSTNLFTSTVTGASATFIDSGALSTAMTGGHTFLMGLLTAASGCGTNPQAGWMTMVYE